MTVSDWIGNAVSHVREDGFIQGLRISTDEFRSGALRRIDPYVSGEPIFDYEWDLLIILDACRPDLLEEVAEGYDFVPADPATIRSLASNSHIWMERNFASDWRSETKNTAYITGNPYTDEYVTSDQFAYLDEVWRYAWDDEIGTVPARPITDRATNAARTRSFDRLLVHYMQPHFPSVPDPIGSEIELETFGEKWGSVWDNLKSGDVSSERVWKSYRENLKYVLDDVNLLLDNVNSKKTVISADHGNSFGRFGIYEHPPHIPLSTIRNVPWVETSADDTGTYESTISDKDTNVTENEVTSRLKDLGYL